MCHRLLFNFLQVHFKFHSAIALVGEGYSLISLFSTGMYKDGELLAD